MAKIIKLKPTSAGRRFTVKISKNGIYKGRPLKSLVKSGSKASGRNNQGRITVRHRGGGVKKLIRQVDFKRDKIGISGRVERIEHDPHRRAYLALIVYVDGERRYILAPQGLKIGDTVMSGEEAPIKPGNCLPLHRIPLGTTINSIQLKPGKKAQLVRGAGVGATLLSKESSYVTIRLPSTEIRKVNIECYSTIGALSNPEHDLIVLGKAGASRWRGRRPTVRGVAMNPVDHPLGGGEGKSSGGRHPVSFTGKKEKVTRNNKRTDKVIIAKRKKRK